MSQAAEVGENDDLALLGPERGERLGDATARELESGALGGIV